MQFRVAKQKQCGTVLVPQSARDSPCRFGHARSLKTRVVFYEMSDACGCDASNANEARGLASCFSLEGRAA